MGMQVKLRDCTRFPNAIGEIIGREDKAYRIRLIDRKNLDTILVLKSGQFVARGSVYTRPDSMSLREYAASLTAKPKPELYVHKIPQQFPTKLLEAGTLAAQLALAQELARLNPPPKPTHTGQYTVLDLEFITAPNSQKPIGVMLVFNGNLQIDYYWPRMTKRGQRGGNLIVGNNEYRSTNEWVSDQLGLTNKIEHWNIAALGFIETVLNNLVMAETLTKELAA